MKPLHNYPRPELCTIPDHEKMENHQPIAEPLTRQTYDEAKRPIPPSRLGGNPEPSIDITTPKWGDPSDPTQEWDPSKTGLSSSESDRQSVWNSSGWPSQTGSSLLKDHRTSRGYSTSSFRSSSIDEATTIGSDRFSRFTGDASPYPRTSRESSTSSSRYVPKTFRPIVNPSDGLTTRPFSAATSPPESRISRESSISASIATPNARDVPTSSAFSNSARVRVVENHQLSTIETEVASQTVRIKDEPIDEPLIPPPQIDPIVKAEPSEETNRDYEKPEVFYLVLTDPFGYDAYDLNSLSQVRAWLESELLFGPGSLQSLWLRTMVNY